MIIGQNTFMSLESISVSAVTYHIENTGASETNIGDHSLHWRRIKEDPEKLMKFNLATPTAWSKHR